MAESRQCLLVGAGARVTNALLPAMRDADLPLAVAAVVDPDPAASTRVYELASAGVLGRHVPVFTNLDDARPNASSYDVALVACPHNAHYRATLRLLKAGIPVLKEKPFALSLDEARDLSAHADVGLRVLVQRPHSQVYAITRDALDRVGPLLSYRVHLSRDTSDYAATWRADPSRSGGGAICDLGYHAFDLIARLAPSAQSVYAVAMVSPAYRPRVAVEEGAHLVLTHADGVSGSVCLSRCADRSDTVELIADRGRITLTETHVRVVVADKSGLTHEVECTATENPKARMLAYHLTTGSDAAVSRAETRIGLQTTAVIESAYDSLRRGRPAALPYTDLPALAPHLEGAVR